MSLNQLRNVREPLLAIVNIVKLGNSIRGVNLQELDDVTDTLQDQMQAISREQTAEGVSFLREFFRYSVQMEQVVKDLVVTLVEETFSALSTRVVDAIQARDVDRLEGLVGEAGKDGWKFTRSGVNGLGKLADKTPDWPLLATMHIMIVHGKKDAVVQLLRMVSRRPGVRVGARMLGRKGGLGKALDRHTGHGNAGRGHEKIHWTWDR